MDMQKETQHGYVSFILWKQALSDTYYTVNVIKCSNSINRQIMVMYMNTNKAHGKIKHMFIFETS